MLVELSAASRYFDLIQQNFFGNKTIFLDKQK